MNPDQASAATAADDVATGPMVQVNQVESMASASRALDNLLRRMDRESFAAKSATARVVFGARLRAPNRG